MKQYITRLFSPIFGSVNWTPPTWPRQLCKLAWRHRFTTTVVAVLLAGAGYGGWRWWQWREDHRPRPVELIAVRTISAKAAAPSVPIWDREAKNVVPSNALITFDADAAPLEKIGKSAGEVAVLSPTVAGNWKWETARMLVFRPEKPLPAGTKFSGKLNEVALAPHTKLKSADFDFTTPILTAKFTNTSFDTDPEQPTRHNAVARLEVNQPVAPASLVAALRLEVIGDAGVLAATAPEVRRDSKLPNTFHLRSPLVTIPTAESFVKFRIPAGLSAIAGGVPLALDTETKVRVPTVDDFRFTNATTQIIADDEGEPRQFLLVSTNRAALPADVVKAVSCVIAPQHYKKDETYSQAFLRGKPITLELIEDEDAAPSRINFAFRLPPLPRCELIVRAKAATPAPGGFRTPDDWYGTTPLSAFEKDVKLLGGGGVLALNGERKLSIKSRGFDHLRTTLGRVPAAQINHLVSQTEGSFESPDFRGYAFGKENIARFHRIVQPVTKKNDHEANFTAFDFTHALSRPDENDADPSRGLFFFTVEGVRKRTSEDEAADPADSDPNWIALNAKGSDVSAENESDNDSADKRFILITDLGLIVKQNAAGTREVFVQSFRERAAVAGVKIIVLAKNGEPIVETETDADGHASIRALGGLKREKQPVAIIARKGADLAFLPWERQDRALEVSRFDVDGVKASETMRLDGHVFSERGIYRPGDTIHAAAVVRRRDWAGDLAGIPVIAKLMNPRSELVAEKDANLTADGFVEFEFTTADSAPAGVWSVDVFRKLDEDEDQTYLGQVKIRVEDFQPDRMKLTTKLLPGDKSGWLPPQNLAVQAEVQTLFGLAAAERRVTANLELRAGQAEFSGWESWQFFIPGTSTQQPHEKELGEQKTDVEGRVKFDLSIENQTAPLLEATLKLEAFEADGGRGVRGEVTTLVSPHKQLIGWKADGALDYIGRDVSASVRIVAIGPDLSPVALGGLTRTLIETRHTSVLSKQENGSFAYVSREVDKEIESIPAEFTAGEQVLALPVQRAGRFRYEWRNAGRDVICKIAFTVVGPGDADRSLERNAELELSVPSRVWNPGESIEVAIRAPYAGAGLITIERDRVLAWKWFSADTASSVQKIAIPPGVEGPAYVSVALVRGLDAPEIFTSPLSTGIVPVRITTASRRLPVTLSAPQRAKPGEPLRISYSTPRPAKIVVWAVDEGIHRITNYKTPDPLAAFFRKRALEVESWQILDLLLPEFSMVKKSRAFGGDGDVPELKLGLNPFKRRRDAPVVFWSGIIESGPEAREVIYQVPDYFAGSLNIMAEAVALDAVGTASTKMVVKGPFVLTPNAPFFAAPGDEFIASLTVANQLEGEAAAAKLEASAELSGGLEIISAPEREFACALNTEETLRWRIRAKELLGNAEIRFTVRGGGETVSLKTTLSVRPAAPYATAVQSGWFRQPTHDAAAKRAMHDVFAKREVVVSPTPLGLSHGLKMYLDSFPHGCAEQTTSKAVPHLLMADESTAGQSREDATRAVAHAMNVLATRQNSDGGFGYWTNRDGGAGFDYVTVYVAHFLTEARAAGFSVPESLMAPTQRRLKMMAGATARTRADADIQAAAIYLMTRAGTVTTNYALNLTDTLRVLGGEKCDGDLSTAWLAATWSLLKKNDDAAKLIARHRKAFTAEDGEAFWQSRLTKSAQSFTVVCRHFPEVAGTFRHADLAPITEPVVAGDFHTLSAAWTIFALKGYAAVVKDSGIKLGIEEKLASGGHRLLAAPAAGVVSAKFAPDIAGLRFLLNRPDNAPDLGAFYQVVETGFDKTPPALATNGIEVRSELLDEAGRVVESAKIGDTLKMRVRLRNVNARAESHLAVLAPFPCGFELAPNGLRPGPAALPQSDYVDVREDRVLIFAGLGAGNSVEFEYAVRPVCAGRFAVPPVFAEGMYRRGVNGNSAQGAITVEGR